MSDEQRKKRNLWMFPLGTVGRDMVYCLFANFLLTYIIFTRTPTNAQLFAITAIMVCARVFDALNDPIMGNIIERTRTKWGKYKPWQAIGIVSTAVVIYLTFNSKLEGWSFVVFFGVMYFCYSITYTMHDIAYWGMVPSLGSDADARNMFTSRATLFAGVGSTLASILIPMFTAGSSAIGGSAATAYGVIALVIGVISILFMCFTIFGAREYRTYEKEPAPRVSVKKIVSTIMGNDQLRWIALIFLIQQVGNGLVLGGLGSSLVYFEFGYRGGLYSTFSTVGVAATAFLMIFYPAISRKMHRKRLLTVMMAVAVAGYALMLVFGLMSGDGMLRFWGLTIGYMLSNLGQYSFYLVGMISIINTVEYNEYKQGTRDEAIIASLRPFLTKMASAVIAALTSLTYVIFGVTAYTNQISEFEQNASRGLITEAEKLAGIDAVIAATGRGQTVGLLLCITILPCILMFVAYLLYQKKYTLDEEEYERICEELAVKETENAK
ncbi:MAG: MFS transporter [Lachnospiraceae bacterium]|nr:MFS transporter [Lachnospiraceae bacterium]MBQ9594125.1 MFS transporter [Lachnospiraceae bacterium]